ncbi:major capsid and protease fusion protein [Arthrobacter phage Laila]|nr:major capsid and protease fusion protein [Arthrobacter phage Elkhorn]ASR83689.1 major capsid and protease fusion protein [Arthrobacter phage Lore]QBP30093.1 major capsid and protease fusion protein [Arthrobacter phage Blair]QBP30779.1 major capsid and protease fusion protein [Arthrobacter phage StewieGriff]QDB74332.1 major capsid and protease fusion protein [Arthrobacter phage Laila]QGH75228.1 major capsid and protease fusion protein [Arthrobacter phage Saphira]
MKHAYLNLSAGLLTASASTRTISGEIVEYGVVGHTSLGPTIFQAGSITAPTPLSKVKMLISHDSERSVGFLDSLEDNGNKPFAAFKVPAGDEGDEALTKAANGTRDSFSVGVHVQEYSFDDEGNLLVHASTLKEVSLVTIPAFENALVHDVAANRKEATMTVEEMRAQALANAQTPGNPAVALAAAAADNAPSPAESAPSTQPATVPTRHATAAEAQAAPIQVGGRRGLDISAAANIVIDHLRAGLPATQLSAALSDVVPADDAGEGFLRPTFIGELWQAFNDDRPLIDAFGTPGKLTGTKVYGWKWDLANRPKVGRYAGNKTEVPSNPLKTVPAESDAQDFAAGWDVARKYIDLGAADFIESVFRGATADYRLQTEIWFGEQILAEATEVAGVTTVLGALSQFNVEAARIGAKLSTIQFGVDAWEEFINLPESQVPWWLKAQGTVELDGMKGRAGGVSFSANLGLGAGQILGADKRAATYYEAGSVPIRVTAQDIPRGGVDLGVFGYAGAIVHDPRAIWVSDDGLV